MVLWGSWAVGRAHSAAAVSGDLILPLRGRSPGARRGMPQPWGTCLVLRLSPGRLKGFGENNNRVFLVVFWFSVCFW